MIIELIVLMGCKTSHFVYLIGTNVLWSPVFETLYIAFYAYGYLAFIIAFLSHMPFILSFLRMAYHDNETRRLIFYRNCWRLWVICLGLDLWNIMVIEASVDEQLCTTTDFLPDQLDIHARWPHSRTIDKETLVVIC